MGRGFFSQGACVLLKEACGVDELVRALAKFKVVRRLDEPRVKGQWIGGSPGVAVAYRPDVNGYVSISAVDEPWPDDMGDPKGNVELFAGWSMGYLTPLAFPGNLERAVLQSWHWKGAKQTVGEHRAFIRIMCSYVLGARGDAVVLPKDWDPLDEMVFITKVADALLEVQGALCYFNPAGEMLLTKEELRGHKIHNEEHGLPDINVWSNVRLFNLPDGRSLMDTVGMEQLDLPDLEATFDPDVIEPGEVQQFLLNVACYMIQSRPVFEDGHTTNGPRGNWTVTLADDATAAPPRRTLRWSPPG